MRRTAADRINLSVAIGLTIYYNDVKVKSRSCVFACVPAEEKTLGPHHLLIKTNKIQEGIGNGNS